MPPCYLWMQEHIFQDLMVFILLSAVPESELGLNMGAGKPMVFPKWVTWVQVWFSFLAHCGTLLPIPWYHGYVQVNSNKVILIFTVFFLLFFSVFSVNSSCHTVMEPNMALSATHTSLLLTINPLSPLTPTPIQLQKQCK